MKPTAVLLAGTNNLLWTGLRTSLDAMEEVTVLDEAEVYPGATNGAGSRAPDIILVSADLADSPALERLHSIKTRFSNSRVVILADQFREADLRRLVALRPSAYLLWGDLDLPALLQCLVTVRACDVVVASREIVRRCFDPTALADLPPSAAGSGVPLTERERLVLRGLATGMTQAQIADQAHLSVRTVKRTVAGLASKLDAPSPFTLGARALALGLVPAQP